MSDDNALRKIDLNLLVVFETIYKTRNISHAATLLGISQPTLSNSLSRLRSQLGDPLFTRMDRGVAPTAFADNIIPSVHQALSAIRNGLQPKSTFDYRHSEREFRVAMHSFPVHTLLPAVLDEIANYAPGIKIKIQSPDWERPLEALLNGEVDLMVDSFPQEDRQILVEPLFGLQMVAIVRKDHPLINGFISREDFSRVGHAIVGQPVRRRLQVEAALVLSGLQRRVVCHLDNVADLAPLVSRTDLMAMVPLRYAAAVAPQFRLQILQPPVQFPVVPVVQGWLSQNDHDSGLAWLRDRIKLAATTTHVPFLLPHPEWRQLGEPHETSPVAANAAQATEPTSEELARES